jgi:hypothetical protein
MNGTLRFVVIAFFLALYYHWLCEEEDWSDMESHDTEDAHEDLINQLSQSLRRDSGEQVVKGETAKLNHDLEELHTSKLQKSLIFV